MKIKVSNVNTPNWKEVTVKSTIFSPSWRNCPKFHATSGGHGILKRQNYLEI